MTENLQETSTGSAKIHAQHPMNTDARNFPGEAGADAGTAGKDARSIPEKNPHPGTREWA